jgi:hypothetical protein
MDSGKKLVDECTASTRRSCPPNFKRMNEWTRLAFIWTKVSIRPSPTDYGGEVPT